MGCISSSPAGADKTDGNARRKTLGGGNLAEASTKVLGANCQAGHPLDKYDVLDTLGTGGFAVVKRVRSKMTGENFAMKIINVTFDPVRASPPPDARWIRRFDKTPNRTLTVFFATGCSLSLVYRHALFRTPSRGRDARNAPSPSTDPDPSFRFANSSRRLPRRRTATRIRSP